MWSVRCRQCVWPRTGSPSLFFWSTLSTIGGLLWLLNNTNLPTKKISKKRTILLPFLIQTQSHTTWKWDTASFLKKKKNPWIARLCLLWGMVVRIVFVGSGSWWGTRSSDDIVTFLGGERHGRYSRVMTRGLEMCGLDGTNTWPLIRPGHESSTGSTHLIRRWGLIWGSVPGTVHRWWGSLDGTRFG